MSGNVILTGPLLSGHAGPILDDIVGLVQEAVADAALERVQYFLSTQIKHPTPYYETQVTRQQLGADQVVHDRGIVYGPWLEGTSRRNSTTRFKGYHSFRKATAATQKQAQGIADRVLARNLNRLGG